MQRDAAFFSGMTGSGQCYPETEQGKDIFSCSFLLLSFSLIDTMLL